MVRGSHIFTSFPLKPPGLVCEPDERSWMPATAFGWALGYLSTRIRGAHGMYVTTEAVESFVEEHYGDQIARSWSADLYRCMRSDVSLKNPPTVLLP